MVILYFPEALNQRPVTLLDEARLLYFCIPIGFLAYIWSFSTLMVYTAFAKHLSLRVMHKASMTVGLAFAALLPLYLIPFFLFRPFFFYRRSNLAAILGICLALLVLILAIRTAVHIVKRTAPSPEAR